MIDLEEVVYKNTKVRKNFDAFYRNPAYKVYLDSANFLSEYALNFDNEVNQEKLRERFELGGFTIKAVDLETDNGIKTMFDYHKTFRNPSLFDRDDKVDLLVSTYSQVGRISRRCRDDSYGSAKESKNVKLAYNLKEYLESRKKVSYYLGNILIGSARDIINNPKYNQFLQELCYVGDLFDSWFDFDSDFERGELNFEPNIFSKIKLFTKTSNSLTKLLVKYPFVLRDVSRFSKQLESVKY